MDDGDRHELVSTANLADGCVRVQAPFAAVPCLRPLRSGDRLQGKALPVTHSGSVDIFLEAIEGAAPGEILVVDNQARSDEGCIGDLAVAEAAAAGIAGVVVWGRHRDSADLLAIALPIFSLGSCPTGPRRLDPRPPGALGTAVCDGHLITADHMVVADDDGAIFFPESHFVAAFDAALAIRRREAKQARLVTTGKSLRDQFDWRGFISARAADGDLSFREHLRRLGGEIEV